ncbi:MAG: LamG-like jellyroll fold domain-containing protein [Bryobacterales bacterium]
MRIQSPGARWGMALWRGGPRPCPCHLRPRSGRAWLHFGAWVKLDALPGSWGVLFSTYALVIRAGTAVDSAGRLILCVAGESGAAPWLVSNAAVAPGQWTYVAVSFDAVNRKGSLYVDGILDRTAVFAGYTPANGSSDAGGRLADEWLLSAGLTSTEHAWGRRAFAGTNLDSMAE